MHVACLLFVIMTAAGCVAAPDGGGGTDAGEKPCDGKNDCDKCSTCAAQVVCATELSACQKNSACVAIDQCVALCGADLVCKQACIDNNAAGFDDYDAATRCIYCDQCAKDCAGYRTCG